MLIFLIFINQAEVLQVINQRNNIQIMQFQLESNLCTIPQLKQLIANKLAETVALLESDEVIEQMRNDKSLYEFKINHIKDLIQENLDFTNELEQLAQENSQLRNIVSKMELSLERKDREFAESIDLIEESAKRHTKQKEEEINRLNHIIEELNRKLELTAHHGQKNEKKSSELTQVKKDLLAEIERLKKQVSQCHKENLQSAENYKKLKNSQRELSNEQEQALAQLRMDHQKQIHDYEILAKKMQNDMMVIKTQWQKKCQDTEKQLREFYENQLYNLEQRKSKQLLQHMETLKQGRPIIIKHDEEVINSRMESVRRQYQAEIQMLTKNKHELTSMQETLQSEFIQKTKDYESMAQSLKSVQFELEEAKHQLSLEKDRSKRQSEKFKVVLQQFEKQNKQQSLRFDAAQSELTKIKDNLKFVQKKLEICNRNLSEEKEKVSLLSVQKEELSNKNNQHEEKIKKMQKSLSSAEQESEQKNSKMESLHKQIQALKVAISEHQKNITFLKNTLKLTDSGKKKMTSIVDKLHLQVKQYKKELALIKEDIKYICEHHKKKNMAEVRKIIDQCDVFKEFMEKDSKKKMTELINEVEHEKQKDQAEFEAVLHERQNLRREVKELEALFVIKQRQVEEARRATTIAEVEQIKRVMAEEIQRQKIKFYRLEEDFINYQKQHHRTLQKARMEVKETVKILTNKWMEELNRLEEDNKRKDIELQRFVDKIQAVLNQCEEVKRVQEQERDEVKKYRKKYEALKQQKQEQIADLLKKLEKQSKHKIGLEKELRSIRAEFNKIQSGQNTHFYHNEGEKVENRSNAVSMNTNREKELSEIRELIAKTYQVVGEKPERDSKREWKKNLY